jgi:CheY-like chemotaxis protein
VRQSQLFDTLVSLASGTSEPIAGAAAAPSEPRSAIAEPAGPRILVVEDTPMNQQVARGMLARLGYRADLASNGFEALDALGRGSYAAILMDCHMPGMDGFQASREIRQREGPTRHTPIIAMTASAMRGERERCLAAGMDDYLAKPVRLAALESRLRRWSGPAAEVDTHVLLELRSFRIRGEEDPVVRLIELFQRDAPARIDRIRAAVQENDAQGLENAAHALKGSSGVLGAHRLQQLSAELEDLGHSGNLEGADLVVQALEGAYERARQVLDELRTADQRGLP